jgi:hypothetical protein
MYPGLEPLSSSLAQRPAWWDRQQAVSRLRRTLLAPAAIGEQLPRRQGNGRRTPAGQVLAGVGDADSVADSGPEAGQVAQKGLAADALPHAEHDEHTGQTEGEAGGAGNAGPLLAQHQHHPCSSRCVGSLRARPLSVQARDVHVRRATRGPAWRCLTSDHRGNATRYPVPGRWPGVTCRPVSVMGGAGTCWRMETARRHTGTRSTVLHGEIYRSPTLRAAVC